METQQNQVALPLKAHTILGVCEGLGEDFGFNPVLLRIPFAVGVLWSPTMTLAAYFVLGAVVFASRLLFPRAKPVPAQAAARAPIAAIANEQAELAHAA
jgi:phage shock protein PspC (stress-responsive transcriptional regulator)